MSESSVSLYYIYDPAKKRGTWASLNEPGNPFVILGEDPIHEILTLRLDDGRILELEFHTTKVKGSAAQDTVAQETVQDGTEGVVRPAEIPLTDSQKKTKQAGDEARLRRILELSAREGLGVNNGAAQPR